MNSQNKKGMMIWRALSALTIMAVMLSAAPNVVAMGSNFESTQTMTTFDFKQQLDKTYFPTADPLNPTLYDQFGPYPTTLAIAQNYDSAYDALDTEIADDFVVPQADGIWEIDSIDVIGTCHKDSVVFDCGTLSSANVRIYAGGDIVPGNLLYSADTQSVVADDLFNAGPLRQYTVKLSNPIFLKSGTYWLSFQVNMNYSVGDWGWLERSAQNGNWHAFRNPGGGWGEGCFDWCTGHRKWPDLNFRINGNLGGSDKTAVNINYTSGNIYAIVEHGTQPLVYASIPQDNSVIVINTQTGAIQSTIEVGFYPTGLAISPDNSKVFVVIRDNDLISKIRVIDTNTNSIIFTFPITDHIYTYPKDLVYGGPGLLYILSTGGIRSFNPADGQLVNTLPATTGEILSVSKSGNILCGSLTWSISAVSCYDISTDNPPTALTNSNVCSKAQSVDISTDETKVYVTCEDGIKVLDIATLSQIDQYENTSGFTSAYDMFNGHLMAGAGSEFAWLLSTDTHQPIRYFDHNALKLLRTGQDDHTIYATGTSTLYNDFYIYHIGDFQDITWNHWSRPWIERLYNAQITGGCSITPLLYCPDKTVTRSQMAIFLERGMNGATFTPPDASGTSFGDVPADYWAAAWIEQLATDGITGGCGNGNYCPETVVTRAQMAVFLLRAIHGKDYVPPEATGVFADVSTNDWTAPWIEQLATEGITGGCGNGNYCPNNPVTRAQMAVFLVRAFNLP